MKCAAWQQEAAVLGRCRWTPFLNAALLGRHLWGSLILVRVCPSPCRRVLHPWPVCARKRRLQPACELTAALKRHFTSIALHLTHLLSPIWRLVLIHVEKYPHRLCQMTRCRPAADEKKDSKNPASARPFARPFVHEGCLAFLVQHYVWGNDNICCILQPWSKQRLFFFRLSSFSSIFPRALRGAGRCGLSQLSQEDGGLSPWTSHQYITWPRRDKQPFTFARVNVKLPICPVRMREPAQTRGEC